MKLEILEENKTLGLSILTIIQFKVSVLHVVPKWATNFRWQRKQVQKGLPFVTLEAVACATNWWWEIKHWAADMNGMNKYISVELTVEWCYMLLGGSWLNFY